MATEEDKLNESIEKKLQDATLSIEKKAEIKRLNSLIMDGTSINGRLCLKLKILLAALDNDKDTFINNLKNLVNLEPNEKNIVEEIIKFYDKFVFSCITMNDSAQLSTLLHFCSLSSSFFAATFAMICCSGHKKCLNVAIKRISEEKRENESAEDFMTREPAATLFNAIFYRRILEHDRVPLIKALFSHKEINWNKETMKELAEKGRYMKVLQYLQDPRSQETIPDSRKELDGEIRKEFAQKLQAAVKQNDILGLESYLQDLEAYKEEYNNVDNLINETVSSEKGTWKGERLMHWACRRGDLPICKALYRKGASLRVLDVNFHSPVHVAIEEDQLNVLKWLNDCDDNLIRDFADFGWDNPYLTEKYLFKLREGNVNLPILEYLLSLDCDKLLNNDNIDHVLTQAIDDCKNNGDFSCIDTILKGAEVCKRITPDRLKNAADDQLLSRLLAAASKECIEDIIDTDKKFFKGWKRKCPEALPKVFSKFKIESNEGNIKITDVNNNGKLIFREISKLKDVSLLNEPDVSTYIDDHLICILPYYIDVFLSSFHLFCVSVYCVVYGAREIEDAAINCTRSSPLHVEQQLNNYLWYSFWAAIILSLVKPVIAFCIKRHRFIYSLDMVETVSYGLSISILVQPWFLEEWKLVTIIPCLFISWIDLFMKLKIIPHELGLYMEMFYSILKTFIGVLLMFSMFLLCFSTAFYILFHEAEPFQSFHSAAGKTLAMMTGEFDFNGLFLPSLPECPTPLIRLSPQVLSNSPDDIDTIQYPSIIAYYVFFIFCICLHILLLNLLVGLAVGDIFKIMNASKGRRLCKRAEMIADLEPFWRTAENIHGWMRCNGRHNPENDVESGKKAAGSKEGEHLVKGLEPAPQELKRESGTLLNKLRQFSQKWYGSWLFDLLGLKSTKETTDETVSEIKVMNDKRQEEREEITENVDLMKEVIFRLEKQNRNLMDIINISNGEFKKKIDEIDQRTRETFDRLPLT